MNSLAVQGFEGGGFQRLLRLEVVESDHPRSIAFCRVRVGNDTAVLYYYAEGSQREEPGAQYVPERKRQLPRFLFFSGIN